VQGLCRAAQEGASDAVSGAGGSTSRRQRPWREQPEISRVRDGEMQRQRKELHVTCGRGQEEEWRREEPGEDDDGGGAVPSGGLGCTDTGSDTPIRTVIRQL
jgi:hypothetical protein